MAPRVKAFASNPEDLNSIPGTHMVEGENTHTHSLIFKNKNEF